MNIARIKTYALACLVAGAGVACQDDEAADRRPAELPARLTDGTWELTKRAWQVDNQPTTEIALNPQDTDTWTFYADSLVVDGWQPPLPLSEGDDPERLVQSYRLGEVGVVDLAGMRQGLVEAWKQRGFQLTFLTITRVDNQLQIRQSLQESPSASFRVVITETLMHRE